MAHQPPAPRTEKQNGVIIPVGKATSLEQTAVKSLEDTCLENYEGADLSLRGKNNLEAAISSLVQAAANGDPDARTELLDRVMGKPLQRQDIRSQNVTLVGFLDQVAQADAGPIPTAEVVDNDIILK